MVEIWDFERQVLRHILRTSDSRLESMAFSPDGTLLTCTNIRGHVRRLELWDPESGTHLKALQDPLDYVTAMAFANSKLVASSSSPGIIKLWDTTEWTGVSSHLGSAGAANTHDSLEGADETLTSAPVEMVTFSPTGRMLASSSLTGPKIRLWDPRKRTPFATLVTDSPPSVCLFAR